MGLCREQDYLSAANRLVGTEHSSSPQSTAEPQVPSVINFGFLQLHQPFWCISSRGRTLQPRVRAWSAPGRDAP